MKLTVLCCLGAYPYKGEGTSSYLLESEGFHLLIDAGSTTLVRLENYLDPLKLDAVILSHYHHDHIADLGVFNIIVSFIQRWNRRLFCQYMAIHKIKCISKN